MVEDAEANAAADRKNLNRLKLNQSKHFVIKKKTIEQLEATID